MRREGLQLEIHERMQVDLMLEVGAVAEEVRVTAESPLFQTATQCPRVPSMMSSMMGPQ